MIGDLTEEAIDGARNRTDGTPLREALRAAGLAGLPRRQLEPGRYKGYYEMHIEQGTQLEAAGLRLGVVTGIVAIWQWRIVVEGQQDHAGGTTMAERRDAGLSAVRLLAAIDAEFPRIVGERTTWTTGRFRLDPDAPNIIPGRAEILFQFRDVSVAVLERLEAGLRALVQEANRRERCRITLSPVSKTVPALCDPAMMQALSEAAESLGAGRLAGDALGRRPRRTGHRAHHAGIDAVRALDRRHLASLERGHEGRGPGSGHADLASRGGAVPREVRSAIPPETRRHPGQAAKQRSSGIHREAPEPSDGSRAGPG